MLYRFRKAMQSESAGWVNPSPNEPLVAATCQSLPAALFARKELIKDISRKISKIHDETLDEAAVRSVNDDINQLIKRKAEWDTRMRDLGHVERDKTLKWGDELLPEPGNVHGYLYFGRAKELPGVRELLQPKREERVRLPARVLQIERHADADYFGFASAGGHEHRDEHEEARRMTEAAAEGKLCMSDSPLADWVSGLPLLLPPIEVLPAPDVPLVPTQEQVERHMIERRKAELLQRYASP